MDARVGNGYIVPAAALNFVKMLVITLLIPLLDRAIYPLMGYFDRHPTLLQRIGLSSTSRVVDTGAKSRLYLLLSAFTVNGW